MRVRLLSWPHFFLAGAMAACGSGSSTAPSTVAAPSVAGPIGEVDLLSASVPFGETIPTVRLGTQGQAAPSLTFTFAVRTFESQTDILAQVWVRTEAVRCMGAGFGNVTFAAGERRILESFNVSFQQGSDPAPCQLPYTTTVCGNQALQERRGDPFPALPGDV